MSSGERSPQDLQKSSSKMGYTCEARFKTGLAILLGTSLLHAQVETTIQARAAMTNVSTYHFFEVFQTRGELIVPDVGYVDYGKGNYRELFGGAGVVAYAGKHFTWIQEGYFLQGTGPAAKRAS